MTAYMDFILLVNQHHGQSPIFSLCKQNVYKIKQNYNLEGHQEMYPNISFALERTTIVQLLQSSLGPAGAIIIKLGESRVTKGYNGP